MLVFTRRRNEAIMIGDAIEVRILRLGRDGVRLGIVAPASVAVHRREVYDLIGAENRSAAEATVPARELANKLRHAAKVGANRRPETARAPEP